MAETQRKAQKDQVDSQLAQAKLQKDLQEHAQDNQTKIAIENARLTHETIQNIATAQPQVPPAMQNMAQPQPQGVPNVQ
jgi:hypothetical protein